MKKPTKWVADNAARIINEAEADNAEKWPVMNPDERIEACYRGIIIWIIWLPEYTIARNINDVIGEIGKRLDPTRARA